MRNDARVPTSPRFLFLRLPYIRAPSCPAAAAALQLPMGGPPFVRSMWSVVGSAVRRLSVSESGAAAAAHAYGSCVGETLRSATWGDCGTRRGGASSVCAVWSVVGSALRRQSLPESGAADTAPIPGSCIGAAVRGVGGPSHVGGAAGVWEPRDLEDYFMYLESTWRPMVYSNLVARLSYRAVLSATLCRGAA